MIENALKLMMRNAKINLHVAINLTLVHPVMWHMVGGVMRNDCAIVAESNSLPISFSDGSIPFHILYLTLVLLHWLDTSWLGLIWSLKWHGLAKPQQKKKKKNLIISAANKAIKNMKSFVDLNGKCKIIDASI